MIHRILVNPGTQQAWEIALRPGVNSIGSSEDSDFIISHPSISSKHCEVLVSDAGVLLKNLDSKNGTFVNGAVVRELWLQSGQHIQLGAIDTIFETPLTAPSAPPVNQPAAGATIIVAAIGSPPTTETSPFPTPPADQRPPLGNSAESAGRQKNFPVHLAAEREADRTQQFILGSAGAVMGSLIGIFVWFLVIKSTESPLLVIAWGVGGLTGLGARLLTKSGGLPLGIASAICALAAVVTGDCLAAKAIRSQEALRRAGVAYRSQLEFAKEAVRADSPEEFRKLAAQINGTREREVTDDQIKNFQDGDLPTLRDFALGKPSRAEFVAEQQSRFADEFDYKKYFLGEDLKSGLFMALFAALGTVTAYKVGSGQKSKD